jgi:predicted  nucleic acid-binding Zn-ribbon protein
LKKIIDDQDKVADWLTELTESNKCDLDDGKLQEQLSKHENDLKGIIREANHAHKVLNDAAIYVKTLDDSRNELQKWLDEISKKLAENTGEIGAPDQILEKMSQFKSIQADLDIKQSAFTTLHDQVLEIADGEIGTIPGKKVQLISQQYSACRKKTNDIIRQLEAVSNQYEVYQKCKTELRNWTKNIVEKISEFAHQLDNVEEIEECQNIVNGIENILIEKQEGEVRVHVVLGKGEKIANLTSSDGREGLQDEMTVIKEAYEELVDRILSSRSRSEVILQTFFLY